MQLIEKQLIEKNLLGQRVGERKRFYMVVLKMHECALADWSWSKFKLTRSCSHLAMLIIRCVQMMIREKEYLCGKCVVFLWFALNHCNIHFMVRMHPYNTDPYCKSDI